MTTTSYLTDDVVIDATSPEGYDVGLSVFAESAIEDGRTDGCCVAAFINRDSGEVREQMVDVTRLAPRWRETAARRMATRPADHQTPLTLISRRAS